MSRREITGSSEILGTFVGHDEVQAALEGSRSDREALARRLTTSGYNGHWRYLTRGDEVGGKKKRKANPPVKRRGNIIGSRVADFQHQGLYFKIQRKPEGNWSTVPADTLDPNGVFAQSTYRGFPVKGVYRVVS